MSNQTDLDKANETIKKLRKEAAEAKKSADALTDSIGKFVATGAKSSEQVHNISTAYNDMQKVLEATTKITDAAFMATGAFATKLTFLGPVAKAAGVAIAGIGKGFGLLAEAAAGAPKALITALDDQTRGLRQFEAEMFSLHKRFGGTIDEAQNFADTMRLASYIE